MQRRCDEARSEGARLAGAAAGLPKQRRIVPTDRGEADRATNYTEQSTKEANSQRSNQPTEQRTNGATKQWSDQSTKQATEQPTKQATATQPINHKFIHKSISSFVRSFLLPFIRFIRSYSRANQSIHQTTTLVYISTDQSTRGC